MKPPHLAYMPPYFVYGPPHFAYILRRLSYVLSLPFYLTTSTFLCVYIEALELQFTIKLLIQFLTTLQSLHCLLGALGVRAQLRGEVPGASSGYYALRPAGA